MNKMKSIASVFLASFLLFNKVNGQEGNKYSLLQAQETAINNSEKLKNSNFDLEIAKLKIIETRAIGLPQVDFTGSFSNFLNLPVQVVSANFINPNAPDGETIAFRAGTDFSAAGTLQVNQLLFNGSYIVGLQFSKFYKELAATNIEKTKEDILFDVTQAYQMAVVSKANLSFADSIFKITAKLVEKQANFLELGLMEQEDMDQLEFSLLNAKNTINSSQIQYENALALLKMTMGVSQNTSIEITDSVDFLIQKSNASISGSLTNNLNYVLLSKQVILNEYNLKNKRAANLPSAGAFFQQTYNAYRNEFNFFANEKWYPQTLWGIQVQIPIFSSGSRWSQISQAKVEVEKSKNSLSELNKALEMQQVQLSNTMKNARLTLELQEKNIALAKKIYENALLKEEIGVGNSIIVTQKYNQLTLAQAQYVGALLDVFNTKLNTDKLYHSISK